MIDYLIVRLGLFIVYFWVVIFQGFSSELSDRKKKGTARSYRQVKKRMAADQGGMLDTS